MTARPEPSLDLRGLAAPDLGLEIIRRAAAAPDGGDPPPFPPSRRPVATALVVVGAMVVLALAGFLLVRSVGHGSSTASPPPATAAPPTACSQVIPGCKAERLPDLVLRNGQTLDLLGPVDGIDMNGILTSDQALARAGANEFFWRDADKVRVVLGSVEPSALGTGATTELMYSIEWGGTCSDPSVSSGGSPLGCVPQSTATDIDARTGEYLGGGTSPDVNASPSVLPSGASPSPAPGSPTACSELIPGCTAERLPDLVLRNGVMLGQLGSIDGIDTSGILTSDEALVQAGKHDSSWQTARAVRVVLAAVGPAARRAYPKTDLLYLIEWGQECQIADISGPAPSCVLEPVGTDIDARTGAYLGSGTGPDVNESPTIPPPPTTTPLVTDTHDPQALLVVLNEPLDLHFIDPRGEVFMYPADPSSDAISAQEVVDRAWEQYGYADPTSVRVAFGVVQNKAYWLMTMTVPGCPPGATLPPAPSPGSRFCPSSSSFTVLVNAITGDDFGMQLGEVLPPL